jgi:hypothetical protein
MLEDYYLDELLIVLDAYTEMHKPQKEKAAQVFADDF